MTKEDIMRELVHYGARRSNARTAEENINKHAFICEMHADGYTGFWKTDLSIQHPLAKVEMVAWDSSSTLLFAKDYSLYLEFLKNIPNAEDLSEYNADDYDEKRYLRWLEGNKQ